jgi:lipoic acid synthetase
MSREEVAESVKQLGLKHAVITSVNRDDQKYGGADIFAMVIKRSVSLPRSVKLKCLFRISRSVGSALILFDAKPDILKP